MTLSLVGRPRRVEWSGPPSFEAAGEVRREAREVLVHWRLPEGASDEAIMLISELLANVVQHARTPFRLLVELRCRKLYLAVDDGLAGPAPGAPASAAAGHPTGLRLVNAMALRWGWESRDTGKTVWAEVWL